MNMELSSNLISQFVEVTNNAEQPKKEATVYGTTVVNASGTFVKLDGSDVLTPVSTTATVEDGERVTVMIKNHTAIITGNISSPSARGKDLEVTAKSLTVKIDGASDAATKAQSAANSAASAASNAARFATDYLTLNDSGLEIGSNSLRNNVLISPTAIDFRRGDTILASYQSDYVYLGLASRKAVIDLADGVAQLYNESDNEGYYSRLAIESDHSIRLSSAGGIYENTYYETGEASAEAYFHMETCEMWRAGAMIRPRINLHAEYRDIPYTHMYETDMLMDTTAGTITLMANETLNGGQVRIKMRAGDGIHLNGWVHISDTEGVDSCMIFDNCNNIYGIDTSGRIIEAFCPQSHNDNVAIGNGVYEANSGNTNIYGSDVRIYSAKAGKVGYTPYFRAGHNVSVVWYGAGFVTSGSSNIYFSIPLAKPVVGSPSISVSSVDGLMIRQAAVGHTDDGNNKGVYTHGSASSSYARPSSYSASLSADGSLINVVANMSNTTNALNNTPCGIAASIKITFS